MKTKFRVLTLGFIITVVLAMTTSFVLAYGDHEHLTLEEKVIARQKMVDAALEDLSFKLGVPKELIEVRGAEEEKHVLWGCRDPMDEMPIIAPPRVYQLRIILYYDIEYEYKCAKNASIRQFYLRIDSDLVIHSCPRVVAGIPVKDKWGDSYYRIINESTDLSIYEFEYRGFLLIHDPDGILDQYLGRLVKVTYNTEDNLFDLIPITIEVEDCTVEDFHGNPYQPRYGEQQLSIRYGWNAVSLGIKKQGFTVGDLIELVNQACGRDAVELVIKLKRFSNSDSPWEILDPQELVVPGEVYWVLSDSEDEIEVTIDGLRIYDSQQLVLNSGWNLFSIPTVNNVSRVILKEDFEAVGQLIKESVGIYVSYFKDFLSLKGCEIGNGMIYKLTESGWELCGEYTTIEANDIIAVYVAQPAIVTVPAGEVEYIRIRRPLPPIDGETPNPPSFPDLPLPRP